ncbi:MAG: DUF4301 family protein, partial [Oceanihabitans sp.]
MNFTQNNIDQIVAKGLSLKKVEEQINLFKTGVPFVNLKNAANIGNGVLKLSEAEKKHSIDFFELKRNKIELLKFVPASGAATRMFKFLFQFLKDYNLEKESINSYINRNKVTELSLFLVGLEKFPFYKEVLNNTKKRLPD